MPMANEFENTASRARGPAHAGTTATRASASSRNEGMPRRDPHTTPLWQRVLTSVTDKDWARAREVVEPAVDRVAAEILAAGVNPGFLGAALVLAGANLINENDSPDSAVRLLEGIIETLQARMAGAS